MMTINIQRASNVTVVGAHSHKNCKAVYCITTGEIYASALDAAEANGASHSAMSFALTGKTKTCKGKRFCYVSKIAEHLDEIAEHNRVRTNKVIAYDGVVARQEALRKAKENVAKHKTVVDDLRRRLEDATALMTEAENALKALKDED